MARKFGTGFPGGGGGLNFGPTNYWRFSLKSKGFFWVLIFAPPLDHPYYLKSGIPTPPAPPITAIIVKYWIYTWWGPSTGYENVLSNRILHVCTIPCSIVEDSLTQNQIIPGFSASPLVQWAGWYSAAWDTTVPNVEPLLQSQVDSSKLPSEDRYGIRLPIPLSSSGHEPNFCTMLTSLSAQFEEVKLTNGETRRTSIQE